MCVSDANGSFTELTVSMPYQIGRFLLPRILYNLSLRFLDKMQCAGSLTVQQDGISFSSRRSVFAPKTSLESSKLGTAVKSAEPEIIDSGMILPFEQLSLTFSDVSYYVNLPKVTIQEALTISKTFGRTSVEIIFLSLTQSACLAAHDEQTKLNLYTCSTR